jgi:hypothetical protein
MPQSILGRGAGYSSTIVIREMNRSAHSVVFQQSLSLHTLTPTLAHTSHSLTCSLIHPLSISFTQCLLGSCTVLHLSREHHLPTHLSLSARWSASSRINCCGCRLLTQPSTPPSRPLPPTHPTHEPLPRIQLLESSGQMRQARLPLQAWRIRQHR